MKDESRVNLHPVFMLRGGQAPMTFPRKAAD